MSAPRYSNLYSTRTDLYDLMHEDVIDDARFLAEFVQTLGDAPRVLELGCGSGRLMEPMLEAGAQVTGVDPEPAMLRAAAVRLAAYGDRLRLVPGDMRTVRLAERFDLVVVGLNTFMHLLSSRDQITALERAHALLRPGGLLLLDLANPHMVLRDVPAGVQQHRFTKQAGEPPRLVTLWSVTYPAPAEQLVQTLLYFDEVPQDQPQLQRTLFEVVLRLLYRYEMELLLARTGFALRQIFGDYESSPYDDDSERMVVVASALA
jgi:SAM-dependent methyltransferase